MNEFEELGLALTKAMKSNEIGYKHDASGTPDMMYLHGPNGILSFPGLDPKVYSTIVQTEGGILDYLPFMPSMYMNPYYETITGIRADEGTEPTDECSDCVKPGYMKGCTQTAAFGRYCRSTREILLERLGQRVNRSDMMDYRLQNLLKLQPLTPDGAMNMNDLLTMEWAKAFLELGVSFNRLIAEQVYQGNVANASGTGYVPFNGFDLLITTGYTDTVSGTSCPSLDSDLKDFNYQLVTDTSPADIVEVMSAMVHYVRRLAETTGMMPVQWVLAMRPSLFHELSQMWPCRYSTYGCGVTNTTTNQVQINGMDMVRERDRLRARKVLPIEGVEIPVVTDVGILEETNGDNANIDPGQMASDIYLIPLKVLGGDQVTFMEYFQFANNQMSAVQAGMHSGGTYGGTWVTNNGAYFWTNARTNGCLKAQAAIRPRLIMRTPWLAGRIQNVKYEPLQHERTPFPRDDEYFVDGGDYIEESWPL